MRITVGLSCVALACGSATPQPRPQPKPAPTPIVEAKPAPPPAPSCASIAGKLLDERGFGKIPDANKAGARRGGEAEIVAACLDDRWPDAAIDCMTTRPSPQSCIGQLTTYQQKSFDLHMRDWERKWTVAAGEAPGEENENATAETKPKAPHEEWVSCEITVPAEFAPVIAANAHAHDFAIALRQHALDNACSRWANPDKKCFNAAKDAVAIAACRAKLDDSGRNTLDNLLAEADADLKKIVVLENNARAIDCKVIANLHYGDDAWHGHLTALSAAERKRVAAESHAKLAKVCVDEKWPAIARACIVANGSGHELAECFPDKKFAFGMRWGFPAAGIVFKTGIAECDALGDLVKKIAACDKFDKDTREMILDSWSMELGRYLEWNGSHDDIVKQCNQTGEMFTQGAKERGC